MQTVLLLFTKDLDFRSNIPMWQSAYALPNVPHVFHIDDNSQFAIIHRSDDATHPSPECKAWIAQIVARKAPTLFCVGYHGIVVPSSWQKTLRRVHHIIDINPYSSTSSSLWQDYTSLATTLQKDHNSGTPRHEINSPAHVDALTKFNLLLRHFRVNNLFSSLRHMYAHERGFPDGEELHVPSAQLQVLKKTRRVDQGLLKALNLLPQSSTNDH